MLRARGISYTFATGRTGIADFDLDVAAGELVALLGPNGSGKTTLLRLLARDLRPAAGELSIAVPDSAQTPAPSAPVTYVPAQPVHLDELTGRANAEFFARACGAGRAAVAAQFAHFRLDDVADTPVREYSFGMQRKLMLVQAFAPEPALLLLDEPTIGLDPPALDALYTALRDRTRAGAAVVIATNDVRAALHAARVVFLHNGRKVADASPAELLAAVRQPARIEIELERPAARPPHFPDAVTVQAEVAARYTLEAPDSSVLPACCAALLEADARIRTVAVREADLGDVYRALTGEALARAADA